MQVLFDILILSEVRLPSSIICYKHGNEFHLRSMNTRYQQWTSGEFHVCQASLLREQLGILLTIDFYGWDSLTSIHDNHVLF